MIKINLGPMRTSSISGWKTWLRSLDTLDWVSIMIFLTVVVAAIYYWMLRHP